MAKKGFMKHGDKEYPYTHTLLKNGTQILSVPGYSHAPEFLTKGEDVYERFNIDKFYGIGEYRNIKDGRLLYFSFMTFEQNNDYVMDVIDDEAENYIKFLEEVYDA